MAIQQLIPAGETSAPTAEFQAGFDTAQAIAEAIIATAPHSSNCRSAQGMLAERCGCWKSKTATAFS